MKPPRTLEHPAAIKGAPLRRAEKRPRRFRTRRSWWKNQTLAYAYVAAAALYLAVFVLYPMVQAIIISFSATNLLSPTQGTFVGLANYKAALGSPELQHTLAITVSFAIVVSVVALLLGLGCALLVHRWTLGRGAVRALLAMPWTIPSLVAGLLFTLIFDPHTGVLNYLLGRVGLPQLGWLTSD